MHGVLFAAAAQAASAPVWDVDEEIVYFGSGTRLGHGAYLCGFLGDDPENVALGVSAGSGSFAWNDGSDGRAPGLRTANSGTGYSGDGSTAWSSPPSSATLTLTHTPSGQAKTINFILQSGCAEIASCNELRGTISRMAYGDTIYWRPGDYNALDYTTGTADIRCSNPTGTFTGTWHIFGGWAGANHLKITTRGTPQSCSVSAMLFYGISNVVRGIEVTGITLSPTGQSFQDAGIGGQPGNRFEHIWFHDLIADQKNATAGMHAIYLKNPMRYALIENIRQINDENNIQQAYALRVSTLGDTVIRNIYSRNTVGDQCQISIDDNAANANITIEDLTWHNILFKSGAHGDQLQFEINGTTGAYLEGTVTLRRFLFVNANNGAARPNFLFSNGGAGPSWKLRNLVVANIFGLDCANWMNFTNATVDETRITRCGSINDVASTPSSGTSTTINMYINFSSSWIGNVTLDKSIARTIAVANDGDSSITDCVCGSFSQTSTGAKIDSGNTKTATLTTLAGQQAVFNNPFSAGGGSANHSAYDDADDVLADISARYHGIGVAAGIGPFAATGGWDENPQLLTGESGTFTVGADPAVLRRSLKISAAAGTLTLTGGAASLRRGRVLDAAAGTFNLSGTALGFARALRLSTAPGGFSLTGEAGALLISRRLASDAGVFGVDGADAGWQLAGSFIAQAGSFALAGEASLHVARRIGADAGSFATTGAAGIAADRRLSAGEGSFSLSGDAVGLRRRLMLVAAPASIGLTSNGAAVVAVRRIGAAAGAFALVGQDADLLVTDRPLPPNAPGWRFNARSWWRFAA